MCRWQVSCGSWWWCTMSCPCIWQPSRTTSCSPRGTSTKHSCWRWVPTHMTDRGSFACCICNCVWCCGTRLSLCHVVRTQCAACHCLQGQGAPAHCFGLKIAQDPAWQGQSLAYSVVKCSPLILCYALQTHNMLRLPPRLASLNGGGTSQILPCPTCRLTARSDWCLTLGCSPMPCPACRPPRALTGGPHVLSDSLS